MSNIKYQPVIGLEVHVQLNTKTKLFCNCATDFTSEPNENTCPLCFGHPGVLPVLNKAAFHKAVEAGIALNCDINSRSKFDRKNYFYPDLPKAYQITQMFEPICSNGKINFLVQKDKKNYNKEVNITRIHIEEDAGKLIHSQVSDISESYVDLNRAGTPLIEIVSEPEIYSADEAVAYLQNLKTILEYINVSDCNMQEGSLRCDANVSVKPIDSEKLGDRTEIKNMNTFKGLQNAIEYEIKRQIKVLNQGGKITTETLLWDNNEKKTKSMRSKEQAHDYRYFPEPDLIPYYISIEEVNDIKQNLPELPEQKKKRFIEKYQLSDYDATLMTSSKSLADYYEKATSITPKSAKKICNWISTEILSILNERLITIDEFEVEAKAIGELVYMIEAGETTGKIAKEIFPEMINSQKSAKTIIEEKGLSVINDDSTIEEIVSKIIGENPGTVKKYKDGNDRVFGFFVGQTMKQTNGTANPALVNQMIKKLLEK